jgi:hypothetical protein
MENAQICLSAGASPKRYTAHRSDALDDERRQWTSPSDFKELLEELPRDGVEFLLVARALARFDAPALVELQPPWGGWP